MLAAIIFHYSALLFEARTLQKQGQTSKKGMKKGPVGPFLCRSAIYSGMALGTTIGTSGF